MKLSDQCLRELFYYFGVPLTIDKENSDNNVTLNVEFHKSVNRYQRFRENIIQYLHKAGLDNAVISTLYAVLPALFRSAIEIDKSLDIHSKEVEGIVLEFLNGYNTSFQPFYIINVAINVLQKNLFNKVHNEIPSLDIGIGDGYASDYIFRPKRLTVGSEPLLYSLLKSKKFKRHDYYMAIDATCIPFEAETFRTIYLVHSIDHVRDRMEVLKEIERVLQPGGVVALTDGSQFVQELMPLAGIYSQIGLDALSKDPYNFFLDFGGERTEFYSPEVYRKNLEKLGFEDIQVEYFMSPRLAKMCYFWFELMLAISEGNIESLTFSKNEKLRQFYFDCILKAVTPYIEIDSNLCHKEGKGFNLFVTARKHGGRNSYLEIDTRNLIQSKLMCPKCKGKIFLNNNIYSCPHCKLHYPIVESIPLLIPFYADGWAKIKNTPINIEYLINIMKNFIRRRPFLYKILKGVYRKIT